MLVVFFFFSSRRRHTRWTGDWSSDVCSSDLGIGGMAIVYKATHRNQAEYAIKMLLPEHSLVDEIRTRFLREGYAANSVKHPGAVRVVDDDVTEDGTAFLVLELLHGVACDKLCADHDGRLPLEEACSV